MRSNSVGYSLDSMPAVGVQVAAQLRGALVDLHGGVLVAVLQILLELGRRGAHHVLVNPIPKGDTVLFLGNPTHHA